MRWALLVVAVFCLVSALWWAAGPLIGLRPTDDALAVVYPLSVLFGFGIGQVSSDFWAALISLLLLIGVLLLAQWAFLRPRRDWRLHLGDRGRPMKTAVAAAALMAVLLTVGLLVTVNEIFVAEGNAAYAVGEFWANAFDEPQWTYFYLVIGIIWGAWALIFYVYWRPADRYSGLVSMINGLIAGSFLELFIAIGVYAWNPHHEDCWCVRGSYAGLVFGATVMIWAFGPGLLLLFLRKKRLKEAES